MAKAMKIKSDGRTITVRVPIAIRKRGGWKVVLAPDGKEHNQNALRPRQIDSAMVKALARAFRWRRMLDCGEHSTIKEIAATENINESYIARTLRLTLLAPPMIDLIVSGHQPSELTLPILMKPLNPIWTEQCAALAKPA